MTYGQDIYFQKSFRLCCNKEVTIHFLSFMRTMVIHFLKSFRLFCNEEVTIASFPNLLPQMTLTMQGTRLLMVLQATRTLELYSRLKILPLSPFHIQSHCSMRIYWPFQHISLAWDPPLLKSSSDLNRKWGAFVLPFANSVAFIQQHEMYAHPEGLSIYN